MLKISDILKKTRKSRNTKSSRADKKSDSEETRDENTKVIPPPKETDKKIKKSKKRKEKSEPAVVFASSAHTQRNNTKAVNIFKETISLAEEMNSLSSDNWHSFKEKAVKAINELIEILRSDENALLSIFFGDYCSSKGSIYQHSVNVCVLTLYLAIYLEYSQEQLRQAGLAALLHDIGLIQFDELISKNKRFDADEYNEVKRHPLCGRDILAGLSSDIDKGLLDVVSQEHERLDGSGYPNALKADDICEAAKLVGLVDVYESMMHARPYRNKFKSEDVIKGFIKQKAKFEYKFLKMLIDLLGIFPVTTYVKLNTKETGVIIKQNFQMPLKPIVSITHSAQGQKTDTPKAIDLASNFSIYIQECYTSNEITDEKNSE